MGCLMFDLFDGTHPFGEVIPKANRAEIVKEQRIKTYSEKKSELLSAKDIDTTWLVICGSVSFYLTSDEGKLFKIFEKQPEEVLSFSIWRHSAWLNMLEYSISSGSSIMYLPTAKIENLEQRYSETAEFMQKSRCLVNDQLVEAINDLAFLPLGDRLLKSLKKKRNKSGEITITHTELADELGTSREVVTRLLNRYAKEGIIMVSKRKIIFR